MPPNTLEPAEIRLELKNGETLTERVRYPRGVLQNPVPEKVMNDKFRDCVNGKLDSQSTTEIETVLGNVDKLNNVRELTQKLI